MAVRSMTGFGRGEAVSRGIRVEVEFSSVNRKSLDLRINLPRQLGSLESAVVREVGRFVSRGAVVGNITVEPVSSAAHRLKVDSEAADACVKALRKMARNLGLKDDLAASCLLGIPDIIRVEKHELDAATAGPPVLKAVRQALAGLTEMRTKEGAALQRDLAKRLKALGRRLEHIEKRSAGVVDHYRQKLCARLQKAGVKIDETMPELSRELALFADRCDICEEITRLSSHIGQSMELLESDEPVGRTLDFVAQEMLREINTIGSKANDASLTRHVIDFKAELERVREQVQNVE